MILSRSSSVTDKGKCPCPCYSFGNAYSGLAYDYQGRRTMKKVTVDGTVTQHQYFMYRGYQVIAAIDAVTGNPDWLLVWDPAYATATCPLAFCQGDQVDVKGQKEALVSMTIMNGNNSENR